MHTREIAQHLAQAAAHFPWLGSVTAEGLLALVRAEFGSADALTAFQPLPRPAENANRSSSNSDSSEPPARFTRVQAPASILHILSGNTPHAGLQSLLRGLLIGTPRNWCKIPSAGLPEIEAFRQRLPAKLAERVEIAPELPPNWLEEAEVVIVFGSDATAEHFRSRVRADQKFIAHAHRFSFAVVFDDPAFESVDAVAQDVSLFDQQGCLSPHVVYVPPIIARPYAERLASAMQALQQKAPRSEITHEESAAIMDVRSEFAFRASLNREVGVWQSADSTAWTVLLDPDPRFRPSCLNRTVYVKPCAASDLPPALAAVRQHLSTAGIYPATLENAELAAAAGARRICPAGQMQYPPLTWHQDGLPVLSSLVSYIDFEPFQRCPAKPRANRRAHRLHPKRNLH